MKQTNELFIKQMSRKEFLQFIGLAVLGLFGFKNFITFLLEYQKQQRGVAQSTAVIDQSNKHGFGSSKFGV
jgi:hypothetical protein